MTTMHAVFTAAVALIALQGLLVTFGHRTPWGFARMLHEVTMIGLKAYHFRDALRNPIVKLSWALQIVMTAAFIWLGWYDAVALYAFCFILYGVQVYQAVNEKIHDAFTTA